MQQHIELTFCSRARPLFCTARLLAAQRDFFTLRDNEAGLGPNNVFTENQRHFLQFIYFFLLPARV